MCTKVLHYKKRNFVNISKEMMAKIQVNKQLITRQKTFAVMWNCFAKSSNGY